MGDGHANPNLTIHPSDLGNTNQNWIGRSQYGDPLLRAQVDDFNIYSRALSADEVTALAGGQAGAGDVADYKFDDPDGATAVDSSAHGRNATISTAGPIDCPGKVTVPFIGYVFELHPGLQAVPEILGQHHIVRRFIVKEEQGHAA